MDMYDEILKEFYSECEKVRNSIELQNNLLIKFLNNISNKLDTSLIKNGIILILALSSDMVHDSFHLEGKSVNELQRNEKKKVTKILKLEFSHENK